MFYKAIVQAVLLFGSETWTLTGPMLRYLEYFHHRVARHLTGERPRFPADENRWTKAPIDEVLNDAGLFPIAEYISRRRNTIVEYVATRPILDLCSETDRRSGSSYRRKYWWHQVE